MGDMQVEDIMNDELFGFISEFGNAGGALDIYVLKAVNTANISEEEIHFHIAKETMLGLTGGLPDKEPYTPLLSGTDISHHYTFNEDKLRGTGEKLSILQFFGAAYDFEKGKPLLERINLTLPSTVAYKGLNFQTSGFTYSFLDPPYGFRMANKEEFFMAFSKYLFSDFSNIIVYSWSPDCSDYFDAGREWWGYFLCTVYNPEKDWYIGIAASTTD